MYLDTVCLNVSHKKPRHSLFNSKSQKNLVIFSVCASKEHPTDWYHVLVANHFVTCMWVSKQVNLKMYSDVATIKN